MALVAIHAVVHIPADIRMLEIVCVPAAMALRALKHRVVARIRVAGRTYSIRVTVIYVEPRVVEHGSGPCRGRMARIASGREASGFVVRIGRVVVIRLMAAHACGRQRRVVVVDVAHHASHGRRRMESSKREGRVVVIKYRTRPVRGAMADIASRREAGRRVGRRIGVVVVGLMARDAGRISSGKAVVPVHVALSAGHREVEARESKPGG